MFNRRRDSPRMVHQQLDQQLGKSLPASGAALIQKHVTQPPPTTPALAPTNTRIGGGDRLVKRKSDPIPFRQNALMERHNSELQLHEDRQAADYRDFCMYTRILNGMSAASSSARSQGCLQNIIRTRHHPNASVWSGNNNTLAAANTTTPGTVLRPKPTTATATPLAFPSATATIWKPIPRHITALPSQYHHASMPNMAESERGIFDLEI